MNVNPTETIKRLGQFRKALALMGGTHTLEDVLEMISTGAMQSHVYKRSWAITQIFEFPQKKVCEIFLAMGELDELLELHDQIVAFATAQECDLLRAIGRPGWQMFTEDYAWTIGAQMYVKELP